jgi:CRP-like cAMP-binding protein
MTETGIVAPHEHWLLSGVPMDILQPALDAGWEVRFLPGEMLLREGDPPDGLFLILAGSARVTATNDRGETFLAAVHANDVLGEMGVLDGEPRSGTATAVTICVSYFMPTEPFVDLLERSTKVSNRLLALLTHRLRRMNSRLLEIPANASVSIEDAPIAP